MEVGLGGELGVKELPRNENMRNHDLLIFFLLAVRSTRSYQLLAGTHGFRTRCSTRANTTAPRR